VTDEQHTTAAPRVEMRRISKRFGPVLANDSVDLTLWPGEIHAVLGENGAGKTTLMNILSGMYQPDSGEVLIDGLSVSIETPVDALNLGIGTVYQHFTLVPNLSVIENVILGTEKGFRLDLREAQQKLTAMLTDFDLNATPETQVRHLSIGQRQRIEIIKVLYRGSRVLLLDEPTSVLTPVEVEGLFSIVRRLREQGVAVVIITHKLDEALDLADRITVLRQGRKVGDLGPDDLRGVDKETARARIVESMFGGLPADVAGSHAAGPGVGEVRLSLQGISAPDDRGIEAVRGFDLELHAG
jgi:general nucleoside transport system ATP-binding protein